MALKRSKSLIEHELSQNSQDRAVAKSTDDLETPPKISVGPTPTYDLFEMLFADDLETPPKTKKSKLESKCAELDIPPVVKTLELNSAEDDKENMSCWDAWKDKVNKKHDAAEKELPDEDAAEKELPDEDENMSCMDAWLLWAVKQPTQFTQSDIAFHCGDDIFL